MVEEERYLLELVRYLHLNALRAQLVADLRALDRYAWSGHSALLGFVARPWQATAEVLARFARNARRARRAYRAFVASGIPQGRRPELQGGGLVRSHGGWRAVAALRRGREAYVGDERILGSSAFVAEVRRSVEMAARPAPRRLALATLLARVCRHVGIRADQLAGGSRRAAVSRARDGIAYLWMEGLGHPGRPLAAVLGVRPQAVYQAGARGRQGRAEWDRLLES